MPDATAARHRDGESATVIVPTARGGRRLERLLDSLADRPDWAEVVIVDNDSGDRSLNEAGRARPGVRVLAPGVNLGFGRAINLAARSCATRSIVLVNDDCVCDPGFVAELVGALDPPAGVTMAAAVMRERGAAGVIDTAGVEVGDGLFAFDYLNGEPQAAVATAPDPLGPSGAAAAFDRAAFLAAAGFDERIFAYLEDVDLALRMWLAGGRCRLARGAGGVHEHSATLGPGSERKDYLMGFARGYLLRKWSVLASPARALRVLAAEATICSGQAVMDRTAAGIRGRRDGLRTPVSRLPYPAAAIAAQPARGRGGARLGRRLRRRRRLGSGPPASDGRSQGAMVVLHAGEIGGPLRSLERDLEWLAASGELTVVVPEGDPAPPLPSGAAVERLALAPLMLPAGPLAASREIAGIRRAARDMGRLIAAERPDVVVVVTTMLPGAVLAARRSGVPLIVYAAELHTGPGTGGWRRLGGRALLRLTAASADAVIACSDAVARQFAGSRRGALFVAPPAVGTTSRGGDGARFRRELDLGDMPVVLAVGNVTRGRGQDVLVRAMPAIEAAAGELALVVVGARFDRPKDRAFEHELCAAARELGVRLILTGQRANMADAYAAAAVVVNPVLAAESFGRVACEALVAGVPVVATAVGAVPETLRDIEGVQLVEPGSPGAIATAVAETLSDEAAATRAERGGEAVLARYPAEESLATFRQAVEAVLRP